MPALASSTLFFALWAAFPWPADPPELHGERTSRDAAEDMARRAVGANRARLVDLLDDTDAAVRLIAARALMRAGDPSAMATAVRWAGAGTARERLAGLDALRSSRTLPPPARRAVERILSDEDPALRAAALGLLAEHDVGPSVVAVARALEDTVASIRLTAVHLLASARDPRTTLALLRRTSDADALVRREAVAALGAAGDPGAGAALLRLLESAPEDLRRAAVEGLGSLRLAEAVAPLAMRARARPADDLALRAQWALGQIGTAEALAALVALLRVSPVAPETEAALLAAGPNALPPLLEELGAEDGAHGAAAVLLGRLGDRRAVHPLAALARQRGPARASALRALSALASPEGLEAAVSAADDESLDVRRAAMRVLAALADDRSAVVLDRGLLDGDSEVRRSALVLAGRLGERGRLEAVWRRLADREPSVRRQALVTLRDLAAPASCERLARAATALEGHGEPEPELLGDALERTAHARCREPLRRMLGQAHGATRVALLRGLAATGPDASEPAVALWLSELSSDPASAEIAARALAGSALSARSVSALLAMRPRLPPSPAALLCRSLATSHAGRRHLREIVANDAESAEVRAAAAWTLAGDRGEESRSVLRHATHSLHPALAANAGAALAAGPSLRQAWTRLQLRTADQDLGARRWITVSASDGTTLWARTGPSGWADLTGLSDGDLAVRVVDHAIQLRGGK